MVYVDGEKRGEMAGEMVYVDGEKRGEMAGEMVWEESYCAVHFIAPERKMNRRRRAEESPAPLVFRARRKNAAVARN